MLLRKDAECDGAEGGKRDFDSENAGRGSWRSADRS